MTQKCPRSKKIAGQGNVGIGKTDSKFNQSSLGITIGLNFN